MQRLGHELGVTPMAIYRHFRNKEEVIDGILDRFTREAAITSHGTDARDWHQWLRRTFVAMHAALTEVPGVLPFVAASEHWRFGEAARATLDEALAVLSDAGFSRRTAVEVYMTCLAMTVGWATLAGGVASVPASAGRLDAGLSRFLRGVVAERGPRSEP